MTQRNTMRALISLTDNLVITGWMVKNIYFMSATDAGKITEKDHSSIGKFMQSKAAKPLPDIDKTTVQIDDPEGKGGKITLYTTNCVKEYWWHWALKGNLKAIAILKALSNTDLNRLYDVAFYGEQKSESEYQAERTLIEQLEIARDLCKARHQGFQLKCVTQKFAPHAVHNRMTLKISGMDAKLARELKMILKGNKKIGLNHYHPEHELALRQLAVAKRIFTGARIPGFTWEQQVDRAVERAQKEVQV